MTTLKNTTPISTLHIADVARRISDTGIQVGCWYSSINGVADSGYFGSIAGSTICLNNRTGFVFVENSPATAGVLKDLFGHQGVLHLLAKTRRQFEDALRKNRFGVFTGLIDQFLSDGGRPTEEENDPEIYKAARRRLEDKLRKDVFFLLGTLRGATY